MIQCIAALLMVAAWSTALEKSWPMEPYLSAIVPSAESTVAEAVALGSPAHKDISPSNHSVAAVPDNAVSPLIIEMVVEPDWLGWKGIQLLCHGNLYGGEGHFGNDKDNLHTTISGTIRSMEAGTWLVTYRLELSLRQGGEAKRIYSIGSGVLLENKAVTIVTIGGLSVTMRLSPLEEKQASQQAG